MTNEVIKVLLMLFLFSFLEIAVHLSESSVLRRLKIPVTRARRRVRLHRRSQ